MPYLVAQWRRDHPGEQIPNGQVFTQPWPAGPGGGRRDQVIAGRCAASTSRTVNRELEDKARALAGLKGLVTHLRTCPDGTPVDR